MLLRIMGNDIRTAHDDLGGVAAAVEFRPDVVLLDIGLPKLNGYDTCRHMRAESGGTGVVLIAVIGSGRRRTAAGSREVGFDHHMVKPVDPHALMEMLDGLSAAAKA